MTALTEAGGGVVAAMKRAAETIRYIDHSGMVPGSADLTAGALDKSAGDAQTLLVSAALAARMMKANGLDGVAEYAALRDAIHKFDPNYCARFGVVL